MLWSALSTVTRRLVILQTHFATGASHAPPRRPRWARRALAALRAPERDSDKFNLSPLCENEGLMGRWYTEYPSDDAFREREHAKWASSDNRRSFWIQREHLLQAIHDVGFDLVMEQYDSLAPHIAESMLRGYYREDRRGTFIGIKTPHVATVPLVR